jgi:hypothetical protein
MAMMTTNKKVGAVGLSLDCMFQPQTAERLSRGGAQLAYRSVIIFIL